MPCGGLECTDSDKIKVTWDVLSEVITTLGTGVLSQEWNSDWQKPGVEVVLARVKQLARVEMVAVILPKYDALGGSAVLDASHFVYNEGFLVDAVCESVMSEIGGRGEEVCVAIAHAVDRKHLAAPLTRSELARVFTSGIVCTRHLTSNRVFQGVMHVLEEWGGIKSNGKARRRPLTPSKPSKHSRA